jgi:sensor histidine kinase YesM
MLVDLVALLRGALATTRRELAPLADELRLLTAYLDIMRIRMGERLQYRIDLPPALQQRPVPPLLLQPLVENAIRHGLEPLAAGGSITLRGGENPDGSWWLEVSDNGRGLSDCASLPSDGVGLDNVRQRLAQRYGPAARLSLSEPAGGGLCVRLELPSAAGENA